MTDDKRTEKKVIRFTKDEIETIEKLAKDKGLNFSAYVRMTALTKK